MKVKLVIQLDQGPRHLALNDHAIRLVAKEGETGIRSQQEKSIRL